MRLSEAIRLGAMMRQQAFGALKTHPGRGHKSKTCALGAGLEALGIKPRRRIGGPLDVDRRGDSLEGQSITIYCWPDEMRPTIDAITPCPCDFPCTFSGRSSRVNRIVPHLNDYHKWTRERIADWIEKVERDNGLWDQREQPQAEKVSK